MSSKTLKKLTAITLAVMMLAISLTGCVGLEATSTADGETTTTGGFGGLTMIIYLVVIMLVFYFFMIRPENKRKKKAEEMRSSISVGDNITTIGGMTGKVVNVSNDFITFETGEDRVRIKIAKWGVSSTGKDAEEPIDKPDDKA